MFGFRVILRVPITCFLEICEVDSGISGLLLQGKNESYYIRLLVPL